VLIVDGQRVRAQADTRFSGKDLARDVDSIPLGYEVEVKGTRASDGSVLAREIKAKPNGSAMFEGELMYMTNRAEREYLIDGRLQGADGRAGGGPKVLDRGAHVDRARAIMDRLLPPYLRKDEVRVYAVSDPEWNAFAMPNYSVWVNTGLLEDFDDDEVAAVLGHELAHATHEHTRKQRKKGMWGQMLGAAVGAVVAEKIGDANGREVAGLLLDMGVSVMTSRYSRSHEDQADRVGLRYAYEAGFDYTKAPQIWRKFHAKYGSQSKVQTFLSGSHPDPLDRAIRLEREVAFNYADASLDTPGASAKPGAAPAAQEPAPVAAPAPAPPAPQQAAPAAAVPQAPSAVPAAPSAAEAAWSELEGLVGKASHTLAVAPRQQVYSVGDNLVLDVDVPEAGYVNLINIGEGETEPTVLFPNQYQPDNRLEAPARFTIPAPVGAGALFDLPAVLPEGMSEQKVLVVVIHTTEPLSAYDLGSGIGLVRTLSAPATRAFMVAAAGSGKAAERFGAGKVVLTIRK